MGLWSLPLSIALSPEHQVITTSWRNGLEEGIVTSTFAIRPRVCFVWQTCFSGRLWFVCSPVCMTLCFVPRFSLLLFSRFVIRCSFHSCFTSTVCAIFCLFPHAVIIVFVLALVLCEVLGSLVCRFVGVSVGT